MNSSASTQHANQVGTASAAQQPSTLIIIYATQKPPTHGALAARCRRTGYDAEGVVNQTTSAEAEPEEGAPPEPEEGAAPEPPAKVSELTAATLADLTKQAAGWRTVMEGAVLRACEAVLRAVQVVAARRDRAGVTATEAVVMEALVPLLVGELLLATRPGPTLVSTLEHKPLIDEIVNIDTVVSATIAYLLAALPQPIVRIIQHQMDRCSGTNISQFTFGGFATALACDALDAWFIKTMVSGHTKFAPDISANKLANKYNASDCWNVAHLLQHASAYATARGYDESLLIDLHAPPHTALFTQVPQVTKVHSTPPSTMDTLLT